MTTWTQVYNPLNNIWLSAAIALIPIIFFFLALTIFRMKGHIAGLITVILALGVALFLYHMPVIMGISALAYGFLYGLWPISWIIVMSVFLYKISVKTGYFEIIRQSVLSITADHRLLVILVGFSFGAFLEGAAGFGAPVAITAALLTGLGLEPIYAAGLCLIANTAPVAFGAMGIPITVSGEMTGISPHLIGAMAGHQLPLMSVFVPFFIVFLMDGIKGVKQTWPALTVAGVSFALTQFFTSTYLGPQLPDITSALVSLVLVAGFLKVWQPKEIYQTSAGPVETTNDLKMTSNALDQNNQSSEQTKLTFGKVAKAWSPFLVLTIMVVIWTQGFFKKLFLPGGFLEKTTLSIHVPFLDNLVYKSTPIVSEKHLTKQSSSLILFKQLERQF